MRFLLEEEVDWRWLASFSADLIVEGDGVVGLKTCGPCSYCKNVNHKLLCLKTNQEITAASAWIPSFCPLPSEDPETGAQEDAG